MKKYLKLQAKKSVSLFLAVLMVLSCWVWMAPEKAEAGSASATQYKLEVNFTISRDSYGGGNIKYKTSGANGWGSQSGWIVNVNSFSDVGYGAAKTYTHTINLSDFPTGVAVTGANANGCGDNQARIDVNWVKINGKQVWTGVSGFNGNNTAEIYVNHSDSDGNKGTAGNWAGTYNWPRPMIAGFEDSSATAEEINVNLNKVGEQNVTGTTVFDLNKYTFYDQYGKAISNSDRATFIANNRYSGEVKTTTHVAGTKNSDDATENTDIWVNPNNDSQVVVAPNLQISDPQGSDGKALYYLVRTYKVKDSWEGEQTSKVSAAVNVTYPNYTVNFNGGLSSAKIFADKEYTGTYSPQKYNGGSIAVPSKAEAAGYTYYGFWSKPQPATGNASYNATAAVFAEPCTSEDFDSYTKMAGAKVDGDIVTVTEDGVEKSYYNAGVEMDPTTVKTIDVSENKANFKENWYAYWLAKDLSVKFYDVDGKFLGEKLVKSGQTQADISWPESKYKDTGYTSGAFKFTVDNNIWVTTDGTEINKNSYSFTKNLILTPKLTRTEFKDKYTVTFMNPNGGSVAVGTEGSYDYRADIKNYADTAKGKIAATPNDVSSDLEFRYELLGWSSVKPTTGKNYHVLLENADFDVNGTAIGLNSDWVVRNDATYYPVYRRITKTYVVEFHYKDATGAGATRQLKFKYGETLVPPTEYVPYSYVTKGFGYTFNKWAYSNADGDDATLDYNSTIPFTSEYISIEGAALEGTEGFDPMDITATYGTPVATPYTVKFDYIDSKGEEASSSVQVRNEQFILQDTVNNLKPAEKWENEDQLYTYANKWEITEGAAVLDKTNDDKIDGVEKKVGDIIDTADLIYLSPTSNLTFKAVYANPVPYFTVTYIDGDKTFTDRVLQGSNVPAWTNKVTNDNGTPDDNSDDFEEDKIYIPANYEGDGGKYEFQGWFDAVTGGKKYTTDDKVTSNLTLYSQFKFVPDTFTITFMSYDGKVQLAAGKYEKGQNIEALVTLANKAAQGRAMDDTYEYEFLGWDKAVPSFCEGYDVTFTAQYKPEYRYYDAKWYNSELVDGKWVADKSTTEEDGETVETYLLATTHHTFGSKLYTPSVSNLVCKETAPAGQTYTFAGWYYNDAQGNAVKYERGMVITANMEFYATFALSAETFTVTTVVDGEKTEYTVASGGKADIPDPQAGYIDATEHNKFDGWFTDEECTAEFNIDETAINNNVTLYAKFTVSAHDFSEKALVSAPTYYVEGLKDVWCSCDKAKTKKTETIDVLTDTEVPTGTIYLGGLDKWSSTDEIGGAALDNGEITIYANANTDVIITANDTGDVNALYNPSGAGMGVKVIRAFIYPGKFETLTADSYGAAQSLTVDVYKDDTQAATNNANFSVKLGDFVVADLDDDGKPQYDENGKVKYKNLVSGESYIVYYYVVDKAGNQLRQKVRTAKFIYDDTKPEFTVEGESDGGTIPTYCGSATVKDVEADEVLTVNGEIVAVVNGEYVINYTDGMDNVIITATDKAGNTFSKKIKVADHSYLTTEQAASCGVAGYKKVECIICGDVKAEETYDALDHIWSDRQVIPADCVNNGIVVVTCSICGEEVRTEFEEDDVTPVIPAEGHDYAKDAEGNIIYNTVTEATCKTKGLAEAYCSVCGDGRITKELELNPENHEDITITEVEADCVNGGYYTEACSCGVTIKSETYPATGHGTIDKGTAEWYVRTESTCYQTGEKVLKCLVCSNFIEVDGVEVTEEIEATGEHVKTVTNPDTYKTDGAVKYHCATPGCTFKYDDKPYVEEVTEEYTVTFKAEDGTVLGEFTVVEGSSIQKDAVVAPAKADSADGKYKYTFAGWKAGDKVYKLPLTPTEDLELVATYKESKIMYTHKFMVQNTWVGLLAADENTYVVYANLVGAVGEERVPSGTPVFKHKDPTIDAQLKKLYRFEFKGWKDAAGNLVSDFKVADDAEFTAYFEAISLEYKVTYYNGTEFVWQKTDVKAGDPAVFGGTAPTKAFDDAHHYAFSGKWYTDATLKTEYKGEGITADTRLYAGFTATAHSYDKSEGKGTVIQKADCLLPELTEYACACGHKITEVTKAALDHDMGEYTYDENTGMMVSECQRENCDYSESYKASVTVEFVNYNGVTLDIITVERGKEVKFSKATPERAADAKNTYEFDGWEAEDGKVYKAVDTVFTADVDAVYTATYKEIARTYTVKYVDSLNKYNVLDTHTGLKYGDPVPAFTGDISKLVIPAFSTYEHYVFEKWNVEADAKVTGDMYITPSFKGVEHDCVKVGEVGADCENKGGVKYECIDKCGYSYIDTDAAQQALGHAWDNGTVTLEPNYETQTDGIRTYKCTRPGCDATRTETISGKARSIKVTVTNADGAPVEDAKVSLFNANGEQVGVAQLTDNKGVTIFTGLADGKYSVSVVYPDGKVVNFSDIEVKEDGSVKNGDIVSAPEKEEIDTSCKCTCHKDTFWAIIFRLFQKIIKLFTGKATCCACPDGRI